MDAAQKTKEASTSTELGEEVIFKECLSKIENHNISMLDMLHTILASHCWVAHEVVLGANMVIARPPALNCGEGC